MSAIKDIQMASNATIAIKCPVSKRRKVLMSCHQPKNIRDVTLGPLIHVASFLPAPSRAMFAMALSPNYRRQPKKLLYLGSFIWKTCTSRQSKISDNLKKIAGKCDFLDFGQLDAKLAMRLSDDHIEYILLYLDRQDSRVKRLRLTNCTNVRGRGLWRLRESVTIEQIDLNIAPDYTNPVQWEYWSRLKFHQVVDILDSIISRENSLKHVHLPWALGWCDFEEELANFIKRYKQMFKKQLAVCSICTVKFEPHIEDYYMCKRSSTKMQFNTCERCLKSICDDCLHDSNYKAIGCCDRCERVYCQDCQQLDFCENCDEYFCRDHCGGGRIRSSNKHSSKSKECSGCPYTICGRCAFQRTCRRCLETDCGQCRVYETNISRAFPRDNEMFASHVEECHICERCFCRSCVSWEDCGDCGRPIICQDCVSERRCDKCDESFCSSCRSIAECKRCRKNLCSDCDTVRAWGRDGRGGYCIDCAAEVA